MTLKNVRKGKGVATGGEWPWNSPDEGDSAAHAAVTALGLEGDLGAVAEFLDRPSVEAVVAAMVEHAYVKDAGVGSWADALWLIERGPLLLVLPDGSVAAVVKGDEKGFDVVGPGGVTRVTASDIPDDSVVYLLEKH